MNEDLYDELAHGRPEFDTPLRVLTVGAHPDDAEFGAGATCARWASMGADITMLIVTDGSKGSWDPTESDDDLISRRVREQEAAATVLGMSWYLRSRKISNPLPATCSTNAGPARVNISLPIFTRHCAGSIWAKRSNAGPVAGKSSATIILGSFGVMCFSLFFAGPIADFTFDGAPASTTGTLPVKRLGLKTTVATLV